MDVASDLGSRYHVFKKCFKKPARRTFLVFLVVDASSMDVASNLGSMYHVFFYQYLPGETHT